ncbi:MAG: cyclic nucleotide-binding domain-containing protein [Spirochaetales bacterium]|nr:cyclic nucleotide-binding domain-containing protein [Spirochaetales bacterium]
MLLKSEALLAELKQLLIFRDLTVPELKIISEICEIVMYKDNDLIVDQDTESPYFYAILEGEVSIWVKGQEGENICVSKIHKGDIFGEAAIFIDMKRTASVMANGNVKIVSIFRDKFFNYVNKYPRAGMRIYLFIIMSLLHKLKKTNAELTLEKESTVTSKDLERLKAFIPNPWTEE